MTADRTHVGLPREQPAHAVTDQVDTPIRRTSVISSRDAAIDLVENRSDDCSRTRRTEPTERERRSEQIRVPEVVLLTDNLANAGERACVTRKSVDHDNQVARVTTSFEVVLLAPNDARTPL
jgi:hypothetical protein